ncbi:hypothetical protein HDU82_002792 [Entophlyctis luteolus]|nr:hypothetical protein HDU82_002792 [Entophlyctis luteolus]
MQIKFSLIELINELWKSQTMSEQFWKMHKNSTTILESFEDLLYIFSKYLLVSSFQKGDVMTAQKLLTGGIQRHVQVQLTKNSTRGTWFEEDFRMLSELVATSHHLQKTADNKSKNAYLTWDWTKELRNFWEFAEQPEIIPETAPLYAIALNIAFPLESNDSTPIKNAAAAGSVLSLVDAFHALEFQKQIESVLREWAFIQKATPELAEPSISNNQKKLEKGVSRSRKSMSVLEMKPVPNASDSEALHRPRKNMAAFCICVIY